MIKGLDDISAVGDEGDKPDERSTQTDHVVIAKFEKVTRSKNKWKCTLTNGIMAINGRDLLFKEATGKFDF